MITRLSAVIVSWQIKKGILTKEDTAIYQYGYEMLINQAINIMIAVLIAVVLHAPVTVLSFLICYIPLRSFCGGYHARTHERCSVVSAILICLVCILSQTLEAHNMIISLAIAAIISGIGVFTLAPVADQNKPLDEVETVRYRKVGRIIWLAEVAICFVTFFIRGEVAYAIASTHLIFSFMLSLGSIINRKM